MRKRKSILDMLMKDVINVKVKIPLFVILMSLLLPAIAYSDYILNAGKYSLNHYLIVSGMEVFLIMLGYLIAINRR